MPRTLSEGLTRPQVTTTLNANAVVSTEAWYVITRMETTTTETYTCTNLGCLPLGSVCAELNTGNYFDHFYDDGCWTSQKVTFAKSKAIDVVNTYLYDLYYFTP